MDTINRDSVLDSLFSEENIQDKIEETEQHLPTKCRKCKNAVICAALPAAIGFARMGIRISITECPYFGSIE